LFSFNNSFGATLKESFASASVISVETGSFVTKLGEQVKDLRIGTANRHEQDATEEFTGITGRTRDKS
jgi:hypothetical protein